MKLSELKSLWAECHLDDHERAEEFEADLPRAKYGSERPWLIALLDRAQHEGWIDNAAFADREKWQR